jgi:hypothetical protein
MNNILMMGFELNRKYTSIAELFRHLGHDVTFQYIENKDFEDLKLLDSMQDIGIHCHGNNLDTMDWDLLAKELKTHTIVIMDPQLSETPAYDYARVYGRDVWCAVPNEAFHVTCDLLFAKCQSNRCSTPIDKRECVLVRDDLQIDYCSRDGEIVRYLTNIDVEPASMLHFMAGYIIEIEKGVYVEEAILAGLAMARNLQEENPLELKEIPSTQGIQVQILE